MLDARQPQDHIDHRLSLPLVANRLAGAGFIDEAQRARLHEMAEKDARRDEHPLVIIAGQGWYHAGEPTRPLDLESLTRWLAKDVGLPYLRIDPLKIDVDTVTGVMKHAYATRFGILPVAVHGDLVTVATGEPFVREWEHELGPVLDVRFKRVIANPALVKRYLAEFYALRKSLKGAASQRDKATVDTTGNLEQLVELDKIAEPDANDQHVARIVDWVLQYAFEQRASDIHLEPRRERSNVRFRIDGVLHLVNDMATPVLAAVVSRLKALGRMDVVERRRPQDGRIKTRSPTGQEVELRLSTMPTTFGEKLVMRIFDPDVLVKPFADLGFQKGDQARWEEMVAQPHGMVVVTGPTGSGKTTTLYSALKRLARPELNVCTIEDPIELVDPQLNQMYVQHNIGLDFATGVRTLLRQDPDIIMVGEIRDQETADTAVQAALTGHLVLTTLHTNDAASSITRMLDLGVAPYLIKSALLGVVAQRLVRTLCTHCKVPAEIDADRWRALVAPTRVRRPERVFDARGCDECRHTGYRGRVGIYEMLRMTDALRALVTAHTDVREVRALAIKEGMSSLRLAGARKVAEGLTTPAEVTAVVLYED